MTQPTLTKIEVWKTSDGKTFEDFVEATDHQEKLDMKDVLGDLDIYWRDSGPWDVAEELHKAGFRIVPR
jgi:hypothetical protein